MDGDQDQLYRVKAAHMHRLADQAQNNAARLTYQSLEAAWLKLAQRSNELRERFWSANSESDEGQGEPQGGGNA